MSASIRQAKSGAWSRGIMLRLFVMACMGVLLLPVSCPPSDTTPPANVAGFAAAPGDGQAALTWTNPADPDFAGTRIQRTTGQYATSVNEGTTVYDGTDQSFTDTGLTNGTTYYYVAYAHDGQPNFAQGVQASALPATPGPVDEIVEGYAIVNEVLGGVPTAVLDAAHKKALQDVIDASESLFGQGDVCGAATALSEYLALAQDFREGEAVGTAEQLYNLGRSLRYNLLVTEGKKASCPGAERVGRVADASTEGQVDDTTGVDPVVTFGEPRLQTIDVDGEMFTQVEVPGTDISMGEPGMPGIPVLRRLVAVPEGATVTVDTDYETAEVISLNLYPYQTVRDRGWWDDPYMAPPPPPFVIDDATYQSDQPYPAERAVVTEMGTIRGLRIVSIEVMAGHFIPVMNTLTLYANVSLSVKFQGGTGSFVPAGALSPFEPSLPLYAGLVLNAAGLLAASQHPYTPPPVLDGEELMILTHPTFRAAANRLAEWKTRRGLVTNVFEVNDGVDKPGPDTKEEIDQFIEDEYDGMEYRPRYVLLLGDAEFIPPFYHPDPNPDPAHITTIGTDWDYANHKGLGEDWVPDFAVGRIPVDTLAQANVVVDKIIAYEGTPPTDAAFYANATMAGQFDCCQRTTQFPGTDQWSFIYEMEAARSVLVGRGYTVQRIYKESLNISACPLEVCGREIAAYTGDTTPRRFNTRDLITSDIGPGSGFAWNGTEDDIRNAWNAGRFLLIHDDHANEVTWGTPRFMMTNIDSLTNGARLPVVFGINCASGLFDNEIGHPYGTTTDQVYFSERALRLANGGAIGLITASRNTPGPATGEFFWGLIDAIWPNAAHGFNLPESKHRLGDILNHGKLYALSLLGQRGVSGHLLNTFYLWNLTGDPTLEMWTANPHNTVLPDPTSLEDLPGDHALAVGYPLHGAVITAFASGVPIGRGKVFGNSCPIYYPATLELAPEIAIDLAISYPNAITRRVTMHTADRWAPAEVTGLTATPGDGQITLSWTNPTDADFAGVLILCKSSGYPAHTADGLSIYSGTDTSFTYTGLPNGTPVYFTVFTFDEVPNYSAGTHALGTPVATDTTPPDHVKQFIATGENTQVVLSWMNPLDADFAGVRIQRSEQGYPASVFDGTTVYEGTATGHTDTGLKNGVPYYYTAFAYDEVPNYSVGVQASAIPEGGDTTAPGDVTEFGAAPGDGQVQLTWTNPLDADFAGVRIQRSEQGYPASIFDGTTVYEGTAASYADTGLKNGTAYFYTAFTFDGVPNYSAGTQATATPAGGDTTAPGDVTGLGAAPGDGQVQLTWTNPLDADFVGVRVQRSEQGYPASIFDGNTVYEGAATGYTDTDVENGTPYFYTVFSYDSVPNYSAGVQTAATPEASDTTPPGEVENLDAASQQGQIELTWQNPTDGDFVGVRIQRGELDYPASITEGITVYNGSGTQCIDTAVVAGTTYYYRAFTYDEVPNYSAGASTEAMGK